VILLQGLLVFKDYLVSVEGRTSLFFGASNRLCPLA